MRPLANFMLYFLAIGVAGYAVVSYGFSPLGSWVHPDMKAVFKSHPIGIYTHIFASIVALLLGPLQFARSLRQKYSALHRWSGRIYLLLGVLVGGAAGLYMAQFAYGGLVSRAGFALLALAWLTTGLMAYLTIRRRDILGHRRWMIRNYALTFAAVTLRIYLGLFFAAGVKFEDFYPLVAWLCWAPNLLLAEWLLIPSARRLTDDDEHHGVMQIGRLG